MSQIKSYLSFLWNSKNHHGVHSPFVYNLITKCFYDKNNYTEYSILKQYRNALTSNKNYIEVTDFGAGSRVFKSNKRQISKIAKTAGISQKRAELLFRLAKYLKPKNILEIGTSLGLATSALALENPKATVTTLEGCANTLKQCRLQFQTLNIDNVEFIQTEFYSYLKDRNASLQFSAEFLHPNSDHSNLNTDYSNLIYFDGNHSKKATLDYFDLLLSTVTNESVWIFDDIHWSSDMESAWKIIQNHPQVTVSIDTFQWGIIFFRREQPKQHFVIRT